MSERSAEGGVREDCFESTKRSLEFKENKMSDDVSRSTKSSANRSKPRDIWGRFLSACSKRNSSKAKTDVVNNDFDDSHGGLDIPAADLLRICKPVSVRVIRLPDAATKDMAVLRVEAPTKKRRRTYHWKHGEDMTKRRRRLKLERLRLRMRMNEASSCDRNNVNNATEQINGYNEKSGSTVREITVSESQEYNLSFTAESEKPHDFDCTENHDSVNLKLDCETENQPIDESNRSSNRFHGNRRISKPVEKRKVSLVFENEESEQELGKSLPFKRRKNLRAPSAEISSSTEENDDVSKEASPQGEKILTETTDALFPKTPEKHCRADVMVVVNRLDVSYNPLIQKWKDKVEKSPAKCPDLSSSTDTITKSLVTPFENNADVTGTNSRANTPDRESRISNGVTMMPEGNGDASEDDDEIMGFLATRRRARPFIDSSDSDNLPDDGEYRKTVSSGIGVETPSSKSSEWADSQKTENSAPGEKLQSLVIDSSETLPNENRSANKSHSCKSRTRERINYSDSEDVEIRRAPITRSKSRAAMEKSSREYETDSSESQDCEQALQTTMAEIHEVGTEFLNDAEENLSDSSESKLNREIEDPLEVTSRVDSDIEITDAMEVEDNDCDTNHMATNKLTAMKNVMVVLTRLEDLYNNFKDYGYCEPLVGFPASRDSGLGSNFLQTTTKDKTNVDNNFEHFEGDADRNSQPFGFVSVPQFTTQIPRNGEITNESRTVRSSEEASETNDSITLQLEDQSSQETIESDGEFTLVLDETEKESSEECSPRPLTEGIQSNESVNNESAINSNTHKCVRCNSVFNDTVQLEEHRKSNISCTIDLRCTVCQTSFGTLIELAKHRLNCAEKDSPKQKSVDESKTVENKTEATKKKQTKQQNQKNVKKVRARMRCRDDNLTCSMCSTKYESKSALAEHIYTHSSADLQEAYITAKAKKQLANEAASSETMTKTSEKHDEKLADNDKSLDIAINDAPSNNVVENLSQIVARNVSTVSTPVDRDNTFKSTVTTVCACHQDDELTATDNGELQIEMVLLCKYCQVLFRRHDCLEIHYRTSTNCAIDRTRERWPKFYCANCKSTLDTWADMRNHLQVHSDRNSQGRVRFVCNICRVIFFGFGALFFTHWHNHVKDTMFVASRHNFPKISVQPMDGTQKLPAGIRPGENFIFVAEHVCASCRTAFSTRKELDVHQDTSICRKKNTNSMSNLATIYANGVASSDNIINKPAVITIIDDDVETGNDSGFHTPVEILNNQEIVTLRRLEPGEPSISVTSLRNTDLDAINNTTQMPLLRGILATNPRLRDVRVRKNTAKQSGPKRALEDPLVNVVLSNTSSTNSSVSLVFDQPASNAVVPENNNAKTNSYQILMPDQGTSGPIKMVLSRNSLSNANAGSIERSAMNQSSSDVHDKTLTADRTRSSSSLDASKPVIEQATISRLNQTQQSDGTSELNTSNPLVKAPAKVPEIIDIDDEADNSPNEQGSINTNSPNRAKKTKRKTVKSVVGQSPKSVPSIKNEAKKGTPKKVNVQSSENTSGSETNSIVTLNRSGTSDYSSAIAASKISFEESRWMTMRASAHFDNADHGETRMQGFLRVKNLSELQAVKSHVCPTCAAAFESYTSLVEHRQVHLPDPLGKNVQYPKGMAAALVLPDPSERPKTPKKTMQTRIHEKETAQQVGRPLQLSSYSSPPPLIEFLASRGTSTANQTPGTLSKKKSTSKANGQRVPALIAPRIETTNSLDCGSVMMDLGGQRLTDNSLINVTNTGSMPSTNVLQNQDNLSRHQQTMSSSTALIQDASRRNDNRNGPTGYHVLPPMVILPSSQVSKPQYGTLPQRNSSINNLPTSGHLSNSPLTYQNNNVNKYTCNICHTFRCDTMEAFTSHLTKHYTGWNTTNVAQDPLTPNVMATTIPVPTTIVQDSACLGPNYVTTGLESGGNPRVFQNWTVKNTPQGPVLVTPVSCSAIQQSTSMFVTNNVQPAQIVYRCMICKSALYRNYSPLRDHLLLVHGISNSNMENMVQKKYQCTQCPGTTALFDCEEKYRQHTDTNHTHTCPTCRRSFVSFLGLKYHIEHCRNSASNC